MKKIYPGSGPCKAQIASVWHSSSTSALGSKRTKITPSETR